MQLPVSDHLGITGILLVTKRLTQYAANTHFKMVLTTLMKNTMTKLWCR